MPYVMHGGPCAVERDKGKGIRPTLRGTNRISDASNFGEFIAQGFIRCSSEELDVSQFGCGSGRILPKIIAESR